MTKKPARGLGRGLSALMADVAPEETPAEGAPALRKADQFVPIDALPILGTGKLDLRAVKQMSLDAVGQKVTP